MRKHVILLNGPPRSGKDTVARHLVEKYGFVERKFAATIRAAACATFGIRDDEIERWKLRQIANGYTGRDWMVDFSEAFIKPRFGKDFFGVRAAQDRPAHEDATRFVISDAGFSEEVQAFMRCLRESGKAHFTFEIWHIHRDGCSFDGDSRNWVFVKSSAPIAIHNNGTIEALQSKIDDLLCFND